MMRRAIALREAVIATALAMNAAGINRGKSGNVSARLRARRIRRLPRHAERAALRARPTPDDIVAMTLDGEARGHRAAVLGVALPSRHLREPRAMRARSCTRTRRSPRRSRACTAAFPPFHYMVAVAGGADIRCAPYATFGTQALSDNALAALAGRNACLLANHGMIALGASLARALALAVEVETLAEMYWRALQIGEPVLLSRRGNGDRAGEVRNLRATRHAR